MRCYLPGVHRGWSGIAVVVGITFIGTHIAPVVAQKAVDRPGASDRVEIHLKNVSFDAAIREISSHSGVHIIADGLPLKQQADIDVNGGPPSAAIDAVASAFDYRWTSINASTFILAKKFTDPEEQPQIIVPELRQTAKDMLKLLPAVPHEPAQFPFFAWAKALQGFARTLSPEQMATLTSGKPIPLMELQPEQQNELENIIAIRAYVDARDVWGRLYRLLQGINAATIEAQKRGTFTAAGGGAQDFYDGLLVMRTSIGSETVQVGSFSRVVKP